MNKIKVTTITRRNLILILKVRQFVLPSAGLAAVLFLAGCLKPAATLYLEEKRPAGRDFSASFSGEDPSNLSLDYRTLWSISRYGKIIRKYSERYDLDWRLILALMKQESRFRHDAVSHRGAYGLMQIMPVTRMELAQKLGVDETLTPYNNIRAGAFHLKSLLKMFDEADEENRVRLSLAAYNAGLGRIQDAQDIVEYLGEDPNDWKAVRAALPLLNRRQYTLHRLVWEDGKPRGGYLRDWPQTVNYVESIMEYYREYKTILS